MSSSASIRFSVTAAALFATWCALSGMFDSFHLASGIVAALLGAAAYRWRNNLPPLPLLRFLGYMAWVMWQVVLSNLRVARLAFAPASRLAPRLIRKPPAVSGELPLAVVGCSITLTPGTVTIDIGPSELVVHALDKASAREIEEDVLARRVSRVFGGEAI